jgi:hypothetical protein
LQIGIAQSREVVNEDCRHFVPLRGWSTSKLADQAGCR